MLEDYAKGALVGEENFSAFKKKVEDEFKRINERLSSLELILYRQPIQPYRAGFLKTLQAVKKLGEGVTSKRIRKETNLDQRTVNNYLITLHRFGYLTREINLNLQDKSRYIWLINWEKLPEVYKRRLGED